MYKVLSGRGSGKTTKLLKYAQKHNLVLVVPTYGSKKYAKELAAHLGCDGVMVVSFDEMLRHKDVCPEHHFVIDELDWCLKANGIVGYSNTVECDVENAEEELKILLK